MSQETDSRRDLDGKVVLITGANTGIGLVTARVLAGRGAHVFIACRSSERAAAAATQIRAQHPAAQLETLALDLGDLAAVRRCADAFLARNLPLHVLINNAGLAGTRGLTASGFDQAFGVNHVGHFLLSELLLERLRNSAPARIVTVASRAHRRVRDIDWNAVRTPALLGLHAYGVSKLANVLFSAELGRRLQGSGVTTYALHPGVVATEVWREIPWPVRPLMTRLMLSEEQGARTTIYCATSPEVTNETGLYYEKCRAVPPGARALDRGLAEQLWRRSEAWVAPYLPSADVRSAAVQAAATPG
jgi:NAD(P)-dependent dehydrogenase (short-subunit alcohol dehydrogenase family)